MGKRKLLTGMIVGASVGGLLSLLNKDVRSYAKDKTNQVYDQIETCVDNPTQVVKQIKAKLIVLNETIASNSDSAINALNQVENSLQKMLPKKN